MNRVSTLILLAILATGSILLAIAAPGCNEGRLYRGIGRSKILLQGICVVNSAGKVLDWVFMFDDDKSVLAFLDRARKRFAKFLDAQKPFPAERYMKFPSQKLADIEDNGKIVPVVERHLEGERCPAKPRIQQGAIIARVFGRALDKRGKPVTDTVRQENYVEDRFNLPVVMQVTLAKALAAAGTERFKIADDLARELMSHAFMGELDVNPLGGHHGSNSNGCDNWSFSRKGRSPCSPAPTSAERVPNDEHGHHHRLARAGGHLAR